jgi:hypothetical protein
LFFNNLGLCHIESSGSQLSLFSLFSTFSLLWTQLWASVDTTWTPRWTPKSDQRNDKSSLSDEAEFGVNFVLSHSRTTTRPSVESGGDPRINPKGANATSRVDHKPPEAVFAGPPAEAGAGGDRLDAPARFSTQRLF